MGPNILFMIFCMKLIRLLTRLVLIIPIFSSIICYGAEIESKRQHERVTNFSAMTETAGMQFFKPSDIFSGQISFSEIPELADLNSQNIEELKKMAWILESRGIAIGLGDSPTRDSYFDLYNTVSIDIGLKEPGAEFSVPQESREAEMGKWHFGTHDTWHTVYIPGPRLSDISSLSQKRISKKRMVDHLLLVESYATTLSASRHAKWYWNWRNAKSKLNEQESFEQYNKGL